MADHSLMKLGKKAAKFDARVPMFARFASNVAPPPDTVDWTRGITEFGMMDNNTLGDCTAAGIGHAFQIWTGDVRREWTPTDAQVVSFYSATTGYNPADPSTDQGGVEVDVLAYLSKNGYYGHHIGAFCSVNVKNETQVKQSIALFGGCYIGVALPVAAQNQDIWDVPASGVAGDGAPGSWGGHCLAPGTRILTESLEWVPIEKLEVGDSLIGFDEFSSADARREYRRSIVQKTDVISLPCYELEFEDGTVITASSDHLWLVDNGSARAWLPTEKMRVRGPGGSYGTKVIKPLEPWDCDQTRDAGYLAAAFDGEGWLSTGGSGRGIHRLGFAQRDNEMLSRVKQALEDRGFSYRQSTGQSGFKPENSVEQLALSGREDILRFLGSVRPHRLLPKFNADKIGCFHANSSALVRMTPVGEHDVVALGTSTRTYIAEGFASHNCVYIVGYDANGLTCITWGALKRMTWAFWNAYVDEAHPILAAAWIGNSGQAPSGFDYTGLYAAMDGLRSA